MFFSGLFFTDHKTPRLLLFGSIWQWNAGPHSAVGACHMSKSDFCAAREQKKVPHQCGCWLVVDVSPHQQQYPPPQPARQCAGCEAQATFHWPTTCSTSSIISSNQHCCLTVVRHGGVKATNYSQLNQSEQFVCAVCACNNMKRTARSSVRIWIRHVCITSTQCLLKTQELVSKIPFDFMHAFPLISQKGALQLSWTVVSVSHGLCYSACVALNTVNMKYFLHVTCPSSALCCLSVQ